MDNGRKWPSAVMHPRLGSVSAWQHKIWGPLKGDGEVTLAQLAYIVAVQKSSHEALFVSLQLSWTIADGGCANSREMAAKAVRGEQLMVGEYGIDERPMRSLCGTRGRAERVDG